MDIMAATELLARSSTLTSVGWIGYIIIGALAGWIAGKLVKGGGSGLLMNIVIGVIGALIGGFLLSYFLDTAAGGWWFTLFTAILGSVILLWIVGRFAARTLRRTVALAAGPRSRHDGDMTGSMRAWRVRRPGPVSAGPMEFDDQVPVPEPGPGELLVAVRACGVCRTDLHVAEGISRCTGAGSSRT